MNRGGTSPLPRYRPLTPCEPQGRSTSGPAPPSARTCETAAGWKLEADEEVRVIAVANAPCSWGVLEFESKNASPGYERVLDEIAASGYAGTELGDWGFMPTEPAILQERLDRRSLAMVGAFVTTRLADPRSYEASVHTAVETARLLSAVGNGGRPVIVLSDEPTADPARTAAAGRVQPALSLTGRQWDDAAKGVDRIAAAVRNETGLR